MEKRGLQKKKIRENSSEIDMAYVLCHIIRPVNWFGYQEQTWQSQCCVCNGKMHFGGLGIWSKSLKKTIWKIVWYWRWQHLMSVKILRRIGVCGGEMFMEEGKRTWVILWGHRLDVPEFLLLDTCTLKCKLLWWCLDTLWFFV